MSVRRMESMESMDRMSRTETLVKPRDIIISTALGEHRRCENLVTLTSFNAHTTNGLLFPASTSMRALSWPRLMVLVHYKNPVVPMVAAAVSTLTPVLR